MNRSSRYIVLFLGGVNIGIGFTSYFLGKPLWLVIFNVACGLSSWAMLNWSDKLTSKLAKLSS